MKWQQRVRVATGLSCWQIMLHLLVVALLVVGWVFDSRLGYLHFGIVLAGIALCFVLGKVLEHLADR